MAAAILRGQKGADFIQLISSDLKLYFIFSNFSQIYDKGCQGSGAYLYCSKGETTTLHQRISGYFFITLFTN